MGKGKEKSSLEPTPYEYNPESTINGQGLGASMGFVGQNVTVASTGTGAGFGSGKSPTSTLGLGLPQPLPSAYGSDSGMNSAGPAVPPSQVPVLYTVAVVRSFVPALPDELSIMPGEKLKVLQDFDDGWAECMTMGGEIGMVPLECFDRPSDGSTEEPRRNSRRLTSLPSERR